MKILLTRQVDWNQLDRLTFEKNGYEVVAEVPLFEIQYLPWTEEAMEQLNAAEWLFFTSQTPIATTLAFVEEPKKIAVIGERSAEEVRKNGFEPDFISAVSTKRAMLAEWRLKFPHADRIFYPKSDLADESIEEAFADRTIYSFVSYQNIFPTSSIDKLKKLLAHRKFSAVYLTSPSAWYRFLEVYREYEDFVEMIAIGATTLEAIERAGYKGRILSI